jgi:predicted N-formylglutamate amidohydrolase
VPESRGDIRSRSPYRILRRRHLSPLLLTCEHASSAVPRYLRARRGDRELLESHRGLDLGAWEMARTLSQELRATAIGGRYSRLVVDLNRAPGDPALILPCIDGRRISFNAGLSARDVGRRVLRHHAPYHVEIDRQVALRVFAGVRPLLLSVHSFTPQLDGRARELDIGILYGVQGPYGRRLAGSLRRLGYRVAMNRPYSGRRGVIYAAARHGANYFIPYLELEVNQSLLRTSILARRVARRIAPSLADLIGYLTRYRGKPPRYARAWIPE